MPNYSTFDSMQKFWDQITVNERAAIVYHVAEDCNNRRELFIIAFGEDRLKPLKPNSQPVIINNWFRSHKIQQAINEYREIWKAKQAEIVKNWTSESVTEATQGQKDETAKNGVNFLNPDEFLQFANLQANEITDEKERREYLKMIASLMNYKDSDDSEQEQIKAYLPVNCQVCDLYKRCSRCNFDVCPVEML